MDLLGFLDGVSPWAWAAVALGLGALELLTFTYALLWLALAAASVAGLLIVMPGLSGLAQVLTFSLLTVAYAVGGYAALRRAKPAETDEAPGLNSRAAQMIGRQGRVTQLFEAGVGQIEIDGIRWRARLSPGSGPPAIGTVMTVAGVDGMVLLLAP